jgi:formamidopyrimidine-DNA glycosylase
MPELPEVETVKEKLKPLKGKIASRFYSNWPQGLKITKNTGDVSRDIKDRKIVRIWRYGKVLFIGLSSKNQEDNNINRLLVFHLRMSGRLYIAHHKRRNNNNFADYKHTDNKHVRAGVIFADGTELLFNDPRKFGTVWYGAPELIIADSYFSKLGPDARRINYQNFENRLRAHRGMIKPLLLKQSILAGVGNIVADETLWESKIHPRKPVLKLKAADVKKLHRALQKIIERGIRAGGATLKDWKRPDGTAGEFIKYMKVYGRKGKSCSRCGTKIQRIVVGGRGTWICPKCQKL